MIFHSFILFVRWSKPCFTAVLPEKLPRRLDINQLQKLLYEKVFKKLNKNNVKIYKHWS